MIHASARLVSRRRHRRAAWLAASRVAPERVYAGASTGYYGVQRRTAYHRTRHRGLPGAIPISRVSGRATTRAASRCRDPRISATISIRATSSGPRGRSRRSKGIQNALNAIGTFRGDYARRSFRQTSLIVDPPDGRTPAFTPAAEKRRAPRDRGTFGDGPFNTPEDFTMYDRCITRGIVGSVLRVVYGNGNRIVQAPGMVAISYEMVHDTRVLYTDGRPHVSPSIQQLLGDSRARWEGDELVVETTNLTDKTSIGPNGNGLRHSDKMTSPSASSAWPTTSSSTRSRSTIP